MHRFYSMMSSLLLLAMLSSVCPAQQESKTRRDPKAQKELPTATQESEAPAVPTIEELEMPGTQAPSEAPQDALAAQPLNLVYVGPDGGFLLSGTRSRGIFRWGSHWANSLSYSFEDSNYWVYKLTGYDGWFAFSKNGSGGQYTIWKGTGASSNIEWQDKPNGWMRATRGPATGNQQ